MCECANVVLVMHSPTTGSTADNLTWGMGICAELLAATHHEIPEYHGEYIGHG